MTDLSPAAQAVLDAADAAISKWPPSWECAIAAALRAAADEVLPTPRKPFDSCCEYRSAGERMHLLAIAAELEGAPRDPLEPNDLSHLSDEEFQALAPQGFHGV